MIEASFIFHLLFLFCFYLKQNVSSHSCIRRFHCLILTHFVPSSNRDGTLSLTIITLTKEVTSNLENHLLHLPCPYNISQRSAGTLGSRGLLLDAWEIEPSLDEGKMVESIVSLFFLAGEESTGGFVSISACHKIIVIIGRGVANSSTPLAKVGAHSWFQRLFVRRNQTFT